MTEGFDDAIEELLPAYALNALDERDRETVERALEREPRYQTLLAGYLDPAAALAPAERALPTPVGLRDRIMREVLSPPPAAIGMATRVRPKLSMAVLAAAAAWIFAVLGVGTVEMLHTHRVRELQNEMDNLAQDNLRQEERLQRQAELTTFAVQPGVSQASMVAENTRSTDEVPTGRVFTDSNGKQWLWAMNLEEPGADQLYRVWLYDGDQAKVVLATFTVDVAGHAYVPMRMSMEHPSPVWITVHREPVDPGSEPAGPRVLRARVR